MCSFVYRKKSEKVWVWLALCRQTPQVVAFVTGDRSKATCERLWRAIPESYKEATCYSDLWEAYRQAIPEERHEATGKEEGETSHVARGGSTPCLRGFRASIGRRSRSLRVAPDASLLPEALHPPLQSGAKEHHSKVKHYPGFKVLVDPSGFYALAL